MAGARAGRTHYSRVGALQSCGIVERNNGSTDRLIQLFGGVVTRGDAVLSEPGGRRDSVSAAGNARGIANGRVFAIGLEADSLERAGDGHRAGAVRGEQLDGADVFRGYFAERSAGSELRVRGASGGCRWNSDCLLACGDAPEHESGCAAAGGDDAGGDSDDQPLRL